MVYYQKALGFAQAIQADDYMASINLAMALLLREQGDSLDDSQSEQILQWALQANINAKNRYVYFICF